MAESLFVVYASFGSGAEPQILGVASAATRAAELAERYVEEDRCAWRRPDWPDWLEWDSAHRVRPAVDGRGNAVEVWLVEVGLWTRRPGVGTGSQPLYAGIRAGQSPV